MSSRFMEIVKNVGETIQQVAPGLSLNKMFSDVSADAKRMVELGASEAANALNHGHGFVLYGPNQRPGAGEKSMESPEQPTIESHEQGRGGLSM
jgi:hypothetical protein